MKRVWWLVPAAILCLSVRPVVAGDDEDEVEWQPLVQQTLKKKRGEQKYIVGWAKSRGMRALRFEVEGAPIEILRVEIHYAKGKSAEWKPEVVVADEGASPEFVLDPELGYVVKAYLDYRLKPEEQSDRYDKDLKSDVRLTGRR